MDDNASIQNLQPNTNENIAPNVTEENNETTLNQDITKDEWLQVQGEVTGKNVQLDGNEATRTSNEMTDLRKIIQDIVQLVKKMNIGMTVKIEQSDKKIIVIEDTEMLYDKIKIENDERGGGISQQDQDSNLYSKVDTEHFDETKGAECNMELPHCKIEDTEDTREGDILQQDQVKKIFSTVNTEPFDETKGAETNMEPCDKIGSTKGDILQQDQDMDICSTVNTEPLVEIKGAEPNTKPCDKIESTIEGGIFQQDQETIRNVIVKNKQLNEYKAIESNSKALDNKDTNEMNTEKGNNSEVDKDMANIDTVKIEKCVENTNPKQSSDTVDNKTSDELETEENAIFQHDQEKGNQVFVKNENQFVVDNVTLKPIQRDSKILSESSIEEVNDKTMVKQDTSEGDIFPQRKRSAIFRNLKNNPLRNAMRSVRPSDWKREDCMPEDSKIRKNEAAKNKAIEENNFTEGQSSKSSEKLKKFNKFVAWFTNRSGDEESEEDDFGEELKPTYHFAEDGSVQRLDLSKKSRKRV